MQMATLNPNPGHYPHPHPTPNQVAINGDARGVISKSELKREATAEADDAMPGAPHRPTAVPMPHCPTAAQCPNTPIPHCPNAPMPQCPQCPNAPMPQAPIAPTPGFDDEEDEADEESHTHLDAGGDEGGAGDLDELLPAMAPADGASDATKQMAAATEAAVQEALETVQAHNAA